MRYNNYVYCFSTGTNEEEIVKILVSYDNRQRQGIAKAYAAAYGNVSDCLPLLIANSIRQIFSSRGPIICPWRL